MFLTFYHVNLKSSSRAGKKSKSLKDFLASSGGSSPARERGGLSLSAVKSLVLRDKEDKLTSEFATNEKVLSLIQSLFDTGRLSCWIKFFVLIYMHYPMMFHFIVVSAIYL